MNTRTAHRMFRLTAAALLLGLTACSSYVKKTDLDAALGELRAKDQDLQQQLDTLKQDMQQRFADYDARISQAQGRIRVDAIAHFDFDQATLKDEDKPLLDDFAKVMREHHGGALVTVEGFADPAGPTGYNRRLGKRRADAVREYLVETGGMSADRVRAVGYGEAADRLVLPGATHDEGMENRRVVLVVDDAGASM